VVRQCLARGHAVAILAQPDDPLRRISEVATELRVLRADLDKLESVEVDIGRFRPEGCIHLAWYAEPGLYLTSEENLASLRQSVMLLQKLFACGCQHIVMAGTCAEYDTDCGWLREGGPTKPETLYAAAKLSMCLLGQQLASLHGARFAWGRIFYLYGPDEDPRRAIPALVRAILHGRTFDASEGHQVRDYLHVDDVASGFMTLLESEASGICNIASGRPLAMRDVMLAAAGAAGGADRVRFGAVPARAWEPPFICGDNSRLRALGWRPRYTLEQGLKEVVAYWRQCDSGSFQKGQ
jgi:nucleoside-diphosphate-sugar epimerase